MIFLWLLIIGANRKFSPKTTAGHVGSHPEEILA
jgi:hypothetical protein